MSVLITGANRGIGRALAQAYVALGEAVIGTTRHDIPAELKDAVDWQILDVTDDGSFKALAARLDGRPISTVICNAGIFLEKHLSMDDFAPDLWAKTFATNVTGPFLTMHCLLPNLQGAKEPKIAVVASDYASSTLAQGGGLIYRSSKAAVVNLVANMALDLAPIGVAVGAYHPGWVQTDMGGAEATVSPAQSASGLIAGIDALNVDTSGCYESFDGTALPY